MNTNCPTAQHNLNPDIRHFKADRCCSSYCAMENTSILDFYALLLLELWTRVECTDGWPNNKVNLSVCLSFIGPNSCMNDPAVVLALYSLLVHSILPWVAYYGNDHPMQQVYSILVQSKSSYMRSPYRHYADFCIS